MPASLVLISLDLCPHSLGPLGVTHFQAQVRGHASVSLETLGSNSPTAHLSPIVCGV